MRSHFPDDCAVLTSMLAGDASGTRSLLTRNARAAPDFLRFVQRHRFSWYALSFLRAADLSSIFASDAWARWEQAEARRLTYREGLLDELMQLWPAFEARGIDVMLLKGPYLGERFFGGALTRSFLDLDLLVRPAQLPAAQQLLTQLGYEARASRLVPRTLATHFTHGCDFVRDDMRLDLHWSLGTHLSYRMDLERTWGKQRAFSLGGHDMRVPSDEDTLSLHLVSLFEDLDRGAGRLRAFIDLNGILTVLEPQLDWHAFWERRTAERTHRICRTMLGAFLSLFDATQRFPRLTQTLDPRDALPPSKIAKLLQASAGSLANKAWAAGVYECPRSLTAAWWLLTLPVRLAVYESRGPTAMAERSCAPWWRNGR